MSIRELAAEDSFNILTNTDDFSQEFTLTDPNGIVSDLKGFCNNITLESPDIQNDQRISSMIASVTLPMKSILTFGGQLPYGVVDENTRPYICEFTNVNNGIKKFRVMNTYPDNDLGVIVLILERWIE